jgi:hypothetical protein
MARYMFISHEPLLGIDPGRVELGDAVAYTAMWSLSRCALAIPQGDVPLSQKQKDILFKGNDEEALAFDEFHHQICKDLETAERVYVCAELNNLRECFILVDRLTAMGKMVFLITTSMVGETKIALAQKHCIGLIWALDSIAKNARELFLELSVTETPSGLS